MTIPEHAIEKPLQPRQTHETRQRLGWVALETDTSMAPYIHHEVHITTATIDGSEAPDLLAWDGEHPLSPELTYGLVAVRAISIGMKQRIGTGRNRSWCVVDSRDIVNEISSPGDQTDAWQRGASGHLRTPDSRQWAHLDKLAPTLHEQVTDEALERLYVEAYYAFNVDTIKSDAADDLLIDPQMRRYTETLIEEIERHERVIKMTVEAMRTIKNLSPTILHKQTNPQPSQSSAIAASMANCRQNVARSLQNLRAKLPAPEALGLAEDMSSGRALKAVERAREILQTLSTYERQ